MSSQRVFQYGTGIKTGAAILCTSVSGGTQLSGGSVFGLKLTNISGNSPMWVGASGLGIAPNSGVGYVLYPGQAVDLSVDNVSDVNVFAEASGQRISWIGGTR